MKLLENPELENISRDIVVESAKESNPLEIKIELFSCKVAGKIQKQSYKEMMQDGDPTDLEVLPRPEDIGRDLSPKSLARSASLSSNNKDEAMFSVISRKMLWMLQSTLSASFNYEYDFTGIDSKFFCQEPSAQFAKHRVDIVFSRFLNKHYDNIRPRLWVQVEKDMNLEDCIAFTFHPDSSCNPFDGDNLWNDFYFFFNKKRKRILFLSVREVTFDDLQLSPPDYDSGLQLDYDY